MTVRHYHLRTASAAPSERWREAFPAGEALDAAALAARLGSGDRRECMVWLGTDDRQWPEQVQRIRRTAPAAHVVVLTGQPGEREALQAMGAGASGYAHSHAVPALLREVALVVEHGGLWLGPALMQRVLGAAAGVLPAGREEPGLSRREAEVAKAVAAGRSNKEVATMLRITERTVKAHLGAAFEKLGVRDRLQLALHLAAAGRAERPVPVERIQA